MKLHLLFGLTVALAFSCSNDECLSFGDFKVSESGGHHFISGTLMGGTLVEDFQPGSMIGNFAITDIQDSLYNQQCLIELFQPIFEVRQNLPKVVYAINELKETHYINHPHFTTAMANPFQWEANDKISDFKNYVSFRKTGNTLAGVYYLGSLHGEPVELYEGDKFTLYRTLNGFYKVIGKDAKWLYVSNSGSESAQTDTYKVVGMFGESSTQSLFFSRDLDGVNLTYTLINLETDSIYTLEDSYGQFLSSQLQ